MKYLPQPQVVTIIVFIIMLAMLTSCGVAQPECPNYGGWHFN